MTESSRPTPLITLWYKPGQTLQGLIASGKGRTEAFCIAAAFGLVQVWPAYVSQESGPVGLLVGGAAVALGGLFLFSWLLRNFGRWFGGSAKLADLRTALGWGLLPWTLLCGILLAFITLTGGDARQMFPLFFGAILYGFVVLLSTLSVTLRLSVMKTFFCLLLTFLVSLFPLTFIMQMVLGPPAPTP